MSTAVLPNRSLQFISSGFGFTPVQFRKDNGVYVVQREAVFRSGTFRDSWGEQATYEDIHVRQMVENFNYLRSRSIFADVPVRDGHPSIFVSGISGNGRVVGWHTGISVEELESPVDGQKYHYVLADYEITEPDAAEKRERGTWRNRSAEMLRYLTNDEAEFWPVYGGFAFVDIPAVEGLNFNRDSGAPPDGNVGQVRYFVMWDRESNVTSPAPGTPAQPSPGQPTQPVTPAPNQPAQPSPPAPAPVPTHPSPGQSSYSAGTQGHMFTINGQATSDYAAVQRYITVLENRETEARNVARADFVSALVQANLILGNEENVTAMTSFAQGLTTEQFEVWKSGFVQAGRPALLSLHASPAAGTAGVLGSAAPGTLHDDELEIAKQTVSYHRSNNMPLETLKRTASYKKLVAAGVEQA
jgi:hypothetical protein